MFYGCPIVVAPYDDFVCEFGTDINFGRYTNKEEELYKTIDSIINANKDIYKAMCFNAYNRVYDYTWSNYVDNFLQSLQQKK